MISRLLFPQFKSNLASNKVLLLSGPRHVGKQTMVLKAIEELQVNCIEFNAADKKIVKLFEEPSAQVLNELFNATPFVIIYEAQYVFKLQDIIELVLSGEINSTLVLCCSYQPVMDEVLREVLQLQGLELNLLPPSFYELAQHFSLPEEEKNLEQRLIFGNYPEVVMNLSEAENTLVNLLQEVIFTNLGVTDRINKSDKLFKALQTIAFNIGEPLSYNEIGEKCGIDNETVERYVDLLERSDILLRIPTYFNEHRYELKKSHVFYFVDNGIRNALIRNFNPIDLRNDVDQLWRNWLISERIKWNKLNGKSVDYKFWRTHTKQTMDFIEFAEDKIQAYKTSWEKKKKMKFPAMFLELYPTISTHTLNRSTYWSFLTKK
jgi:predicted AAA+ superfamily ATPase